MKRPSEFVDRLTLPENLYWAWQKAKNFLKPGDVWFDEMDVARFEANLGQELESISTSFGRCRYHMEPMRPLPHPKYAASGEKAEARQAFQVAVRDQVAWLALANVIGPALDRLMPPWSYSGRLYRPVWYDDTSGTPTIRVGPFRHSSGQLYRPFRQSWPVFRRHIYLTARLMGGTLKPRDHDSDLQDADRRALEDEGHLRQLPYLRQGYWARARGPRSVFWAGIDLAKFYPSLNLDRLKLVILKHCPFDPAELAPLLEGMLTFSLDMSGWEKQEELQMVGLEPKQRCLNGLPTGLFVSAFLANVAMIEVDRHVSTLAQPAQIAHFRYVDDHVILARSFESLLSWVERYQELLEEHETGARFNPKKCEPRALADLLDSRSRGVEAGLGSPRGSARELGEGEHGEAARDAAEGECRVDLRSPAPLMTRTLALVSNLAHADFELLSLEEQEHLLGDLEHLLLAEFPDTEIRADTRMSFAATLLSRWAPRTLADREVPDDAAGSALIQPAGGRFRRRDRRMAVFGLLEKVLYVRPDKLRLWTRLLAYCEAMGIEGGLTRINKALQRQEMECSLTGRYLRSLVLQVLAGQAVRCAVTACDPENDEGQRERASRYLQSIMRARERLVPAEQRMPFERAAATLLDAGLAAAVIVLSVREAAQERPRPKPPNWEPLVREGVLPSSFPQDIAGWVVARGIDLPVWAWWAETRTNPLASSSPGPVWLAVAPLLNPGAATSWSLLARHPRCLPQSLVAELLSESKNVARAVLSRENEGWLFDALSHCPSSALAKKCPRSAVLRRVLRVVCASNQERLHLVQWAEWVAKRGTEEPDDPATLEWTAVEIVRQIAELLQRLDRQRGIKRGSRPVPPAIHPANFSVPIDWKKRDEDEGPMTWEKWRRMAEATGAVEESSLKLHDHRLTPALGNNTTRDLTHAPVRALGMLLLGLLSRSFDWPASWNPKDSQRAWAGLLRLRLREVPCSSWTRSVLEGCLSPRSRETSLMSAGDRTDTAVDPPPTWSLASLARELGKVKRELQRCQMTAEGHQPRQLIPVSIRQLTRPNWAEDFPEDLEW
ncbi:MAG TPA: RNA-directed DNA polymerase [Thermoanaerobaculaceae bacterium]|nr:RNA-directed DNA polymerase [Thermoanaerobaculaceae bacterium]